jgi:hypothetical protein
MTRRRLGLGLGLGVGLGPGVAVCTLLGMGCASYSTFQTPRVVPRGVTREAVGVSIIRFQTDDGTRYTIPMLETGGRYGVGDRVDIGAKLGYSLLRFISAEAGMKVQVLQGPFDLAIAPAFSYVTFGSSTADNTTPASRAEFFHLHLAAPMGINLGDAFTIGFGPKYAYSSMTGSFDQGMATGLVNGHFMGGFVNLPFRIGNGVYLAPEINFLRPMNDLSGYTQVQGGIVILYGTHRIASEPPPPPPPPPVSPPPASPPPPPQ